MTVATGQRIHLSESLQSLVDSRLDTIERMLMGRVSRVERMAIVREVESQIHELLGEREMDDLSREDVLAVLARLDPPEAYLPDDVATDSPALAHSPIRSAARGVRKGNLTVARTSGVLGIVSLVWLVFLPISYWVSVESRSELPLLLSVGMSPIVLVSAGVGVALGFYARKAGAWALVGIVTSILGGLFALFGICALILLVLAR
jgi:hypothetical protein